MKSDIFNHIDKDNLNFTHVKTAGEARAIAHEYETFAAQAQMVATIFTPEELERHAKYTSDCWSDIADELERQGK